MSTTGFASLDDEAWVDLPFYNNPCAEMQRLVDSAKRKTDWKSWGTYVSDREWSTVREDYSEGGNVWEYFPHDHARSRAYRWGEDAIGGFCNRFQNLCLATAFWNGNDPIIKERLFGLTGPEGNHGEDVKEHYFYLDNTPTHSYSKMLYKYPQNEFPYEHIVHENRRRTKFDPEFELEDTGIFDNDEYFDIFIEWGKASENDIIGRVTVHNRGPKEAPITVLPHLWYRNTWSWGYSDKRPFIRTQRPGVAFGEEHHIGPLWFAVSDGEGTEMGPASPVAEGEEPKKVLWERDVEFMFTENDTNTERHYNFPNKTPYVKDGINNAVVKGWKDVVNNSSGTKMAAKFFKVLKPGESYTVKIRMANYELDTPWSDYDELFATRIKECDAYYNFVHPKGINDDMKAVQRQALAGLLWTKQFYHFGVQMWKHGDPIIPRNEATPVVRNKHWDHFYANDVISMPDKWEYPWFATWDLCFHMVPLVLVDHEWAKRQLVLLTREWYMAPNGQLPAYEFQFGDVNPPVHAWATLMVYNYIKKKTGHKDINFLEEIFHKLLLNFTWWVNRKDEHGNNIFEGGFLGLDNISVFDRSAPIPGGGKLEQADGTAWMGLFSLNMLAMALELAQERPSYEGIATKFLEHFIYIANSVTHPGEGTAESGGRRGLWDDIEGFFFDSITTPSGWSQQIKMYSLVGLIPLFAVHVLQQEVLEKLPRFKSRLEWFVRYRPHLVSSMASFMVPGQDQSKLLSIVNKERLTKILTKMLDEDKFMSEVGIRSLSKQHRDEPYIFNLMGNTTSVHYEPGEATSTIMGGNSNWRGSVWICVNFLMIEALKSYHSYYGNDFQIEFPTGSGNMVTLDVVQREISIRLINIFTKDEKGVRRFSSNKPIFQKEHWRDHILFHEYFHGENGLGLGASHQTGWTALVAKLIDEYGVPEPDAPPSSATMSP
ncbi:hypothetical protein SAMD00019534_089030 [Acytostelium subglobosum LB1]|uniref:hypothetical protein n=1 Tax=Acytostelium subglobosum LB1 TaxID=1410327 RepID=UPI000644D18E|nr:hypothetical protein SAMD00019534_089030 [Acytostelium subglobosum LB1]GAM25728.1 hypothetical protein SAMD00019534_089030 [Acytostelium subglobosum LB1]|eukprot:XP_012751246.1 hypothetical protein SAMD00019534_089030 [Acytostelium subglobosum LB1]